MYGVMIVSDGLMHVPKRMSDGLMHVPKRMSDGLLCFFVTLPDCSISWD